MEQKQRRVKANPFADNDTQEEGDIPAPPAIEDTLKAAEMAMEEQRAAQAKAAIVKTPASKEEWESERIAIKMKFGVLAEQSFDSFEAELSEQQRLYAGDPDYVCVCLDDGCRIGPFIARWKGKS